MATALPVTLTPMRASFALRCGMLVGAVLPLLAALLYRSYSFDLQPEWLNTTRQLGLVWIAAELAFVMHQRHHGFDPFTLVRAMPPLSRWALVLFLATFWISSCSTKVPSFSLGLAIGYGIHILFAGALYHRLRGRQTLDAVDATAGFALGLALLVPVIAFHLLTMPADVVPETLSGAIPGFISHRLFGAWTGSIAAVLLGLVWQRSGRDLPTWTYPALTLALGLTTWTGTRAALLGLAAAVVTALLLLGRPAYGWLLRVAICVVVALVVGTLLAPADSSFSFLRPDAAATAQGVSSGRVQYWRDALLVAAHHPWFGTGMGSSLWVVPTGWVNHVQPHNVVVQFLLFWGLIPTVPAFYLLGKAVTHAYCRARAVPTLVPFVMMLNCILVMGLVDGMFHFARFVMLIFALLAVCLAAPVAARD